MQQQISVITLGVAELARSRRFYADGFGWKPVLETPDIIFYQMNGLMLGTWLASSLADDSRRPAGAGPGAFSLAHNVTSAGGGAADARPSGEVRRHGPAPRRRAAARRLPRLRRRSRRPRLGDRLQSCLADQP